MEEKEKYEVVDVPSVPALIRPVATAEQAIEAWKEYQALKKQIAGPGDFANIQGKQWPTKQWSNKLARFFNLSVAIHEKWQERHDDGTFTWHIISRATAPNGIYRDGDGHCHSGERKFSHEQHDVFATAVTRSKNRAVLELVGFGEVSAEEVSDGGDIERVRPNHFESRQSRKSAPPIAAAVKTPANEENWPLQAYVPENPSDGNWWRDLVRRLMEHEYKNHSHVIGALHKIQYDPAGLTKEHAREIYQTLLARKEPAEQEAAP